MHDRKLRYLGLGSAASVSLATARSLAGDARRQLDLGQDPIESKRLAKREATADRALSMTFKECAEAYAGARAQLEEREALRSAAPLDQAH